jgi:hypothetical protein
MDGASSVGQLLAFSALCLLDQPCDVFTGCHEVGGSWESMMAKKNDRCLGRVAFPFMDAHRCYSVGSVSWQACFHDICIARGVPVLLRIRQLCCLVGSPAGSASVCRKENFVRKLAAFRSGGMSSRPVFVIAVWRTGVCRRTAGTCLLNYPYMFTYSLPR